MPRTSAAHPAVNFVTTAQRRVFQEFIGHDVFPSAFAFKTWAWCHGAKGLRLHSAERRQMVRNHKRLFCYRYVFRQP